MTVLWYLGIMVLWYLGCQTPVSGHKYTFEPTHPNLNKLINYGLFLP